MSGRLLPPSKRSRPNNEPTDREAEIPETSNGNNASRNTSNHSSDVHAEITTSSVDKDIHRGSRRFQISRSSRSHRTLASAPRSSRSVNTSSTLRCHSSIPRSTTSVRSTAASSRLAKRPAMHIVCAVGENLARETCIASLDVGVPVSLQVTKQGNGQTYAETIAYLEMLKPHEILLNEGRKNSPLARKLMQIYADPGNGNGSTVVKFISRSCFDQTKGAELLKRLARTDMFDPTLVEEYILLSSTHALLHYTQQTLGASFSRKCLDVIVNSGGKNRMAIDRSTLLQLELLMNAKTGKTKDSLVASIDCTKTTVGTRLLRTTLMAPPCRSDTINARLDLVDLFLENEDFFYAVLEHLKHLPAIDKMLTDVAVVPRLEMKHPQARSESPVVTARMASKGISALVCIKSTLSALPALASMLQDHVRDFEPNAQDQSDVATAVSCRSSLLVGLGGGPASTVLPHRNYLVGAIIQALSQPQLAEIRDLVNGVFTESTKFTRNINAMRHQECFALKSEDNGMMEIIRKAFLANVDDIYKKADEYAEVHGMHVSVRYTSCRGYYLSVPAENAPNLPNIFIQPIKSGRHIYCTTEEVHSLNSRAQDNVQDLLLMTYERVQQVLEEARSKYDALAALSDAIALLDLCHSFADKVTLSKLPWCRPVLIGDETSEEDHHILIRNGRYAIDITDSFLTSSEGPREIIPNDTYASSSKCFTVISGINGSGKSTYLKQIAIIVLLSHCGGYVPAEQARIPLRNRLCARMGTSDDQENNISSFMLEMKETAFICSNATSKSLVLLDELGRATSNEDGVAIAWAISEFLIRKGAMTFFVTHYPQLYKLGDVYSTVQNQHLSSSVSTERTGDIRYTHKVTSGPCTATPDYGVGMAKACGWPIDAVEDAFRIKSELTGKISETEVCHDPSSRQSAEAEDAACRKFLKSLSKDISRIKHDGSSLECLRSKLKDISRQVVENDHVSLDSIQKCLTNLKMQRPTQNVDQRVETRPCTSQASAPGSDVHTNEDYCPSIDESIDFTSDDSSLTSIESSST